MRYLALAVASLIISASLGIVNLCPFLVVCVAEGDLRIISNTAFSA